MSAKVTTQSELEDTLDDMQTITLSNTDGQSATINPDDSTALITRLVETVVDPNSYAFDGDLYDEDVAMITNLIQARQLTELQTLLTDSELSASA